MHPNSKSAHAHESEGRGGGGGGAMIWEKERPRGRTWGEDVAGREGGKRAGWKRTCEHAGIMCAFCCLQVPGVTLAHSTRQLGYVVERLGILRHVHPTCPCLSRQHPLCLSVSLSLCLSNCLSLCLLFVFHMRTGAARSMACSCVPSG